MLYDFKDKQTNLYVFDFKKKITMKKMKKKIIKFTKSSFALYISIILAILTNVIANIIV